MNEDSDRVQLKESYTYTREVSASNPEKALELLQNARQAVAKGVSPEAVTVILDEAIDQVAGRKLAPALDQAPETEVAVGAVVNSIPVVEVVAGEQVLVNAKETAEELK